MSVYETAPRKKVIRCSKNAKSIRINLGLDVFCFFMIECWSLICSLEDKEVGILFAVLTAAACAAVAVWQTVKLRRLFRNPDDYLLCPLRLTDPEVYSSGRGGASFTMKAVIVLPDGSEASPKTELRFSADDMTRMQWTETNHPDLYALYDPAGRLLILPPESECWELKDTDRQL